MGLDLAVGELAAEREQLAAQILVVVPTSRQLLHLVEVGSWRELAEAAVQEVQIAAWRRVADFDPDEEPDSGRTDRMHLEH